jgi:putative DNA primase/helicase
LNQKPAKDSDMNSLRSSASSRNVEADLQRVIEGLGGRPSGAYWMARCPIHDDRTPSLSIGAGETQVLVKCFGGCSTVDVLRELRLRGLLPPKVDNRRQSPKRRRVQPRPTDQANAERAMVIWRESVPLKGTLGQIYLDRRGLALPVDCVDIRFHPRCPRQHRRQSAVVMLLRDIHTDEPRAIQRRFLLPDGKKDGKAESLGPCGGAVLKASPDTEVTMGLALAEGHADALAIIGDGWAPCWATCGTRAMASFPVLGGIEALTVFADTDSPGRIAAETCAERWRKSGKEVAIVEPPHVKDFADMAKNARRD